MSTTTSGLAWSTKGLQSVCPTGVATFDQLIGGGFALTSVNVIDEDCDRMYATMLAKAYLASGILAGQRLMVFSGRITGTGSRFLKELPSLVKSDDNSGGRPGKLSHPSSSPSPSSSSDVEEQMKIAFHYRNLPTRFAAHQEGEDGSAVKLDFGSPLEHGAFVQSADIEFGDHSEMIERLHHLVKLNQNNTAAAATNSESSSNSTTTTSKVIRILVDELGSPLSPLSVEALPRTLHRLKVLLRQLPNAVCLVTLTSSSSDRSTDLNIISSSSSNLTSIDLLNSIAPGTRERLHSHADSVVRLISFPEDDESEDVLNEKSSAKNPYAADYVGFLHLLRLPRLNSFAPYNAASLEATERYLAIEKLALPPDLGETVSRFTSSKTSSEPSSSSSSSKPPSSLPCASVLTNF
ncbi:Elongator subunit elp4 [Tyrophagus putrescentiae]|nr:Elongator subunit elp4 [Tyrophagus putrescentiae]